MLLPLDILLAYTAACIAVVIVPGPSVTVIIANSLRHGTRAGLWTDGGTQAGLATMLVVLAAGLSTIVNHMGWIFDWLRLAGAAYLIWLGLKLWRSGGGGGATSLTGASGAGACGHQADGKPATAFSGRGSSCFGPTRRPFCSSAPSSRNSSILRARRSRKRCLLGLIFIIVAAILDSGWALAAGRAGRWLTGSRMRLLERMSGSFLIGGGLWLALGSASNHGLRGLDPSQIICADAAAAPIRPVSVRSTRISGMAAT